MTRAELVAEVRRLADETAGLAAEVRRGDVAVGLLGQVRDFGHRLPPGLAADIRRVVDDMVATRHEAHGEPSCSPRSGTSSAGDGGQRSPVAPSTETRQAAQDGQSGSGGDAMDGVPAHQPTPQVGDVYENTRLGRYRLVRIELDGWYPHHVESVDAVDGGDGHDQRIVDLDNTDDRFARWTLVERGGKPWPPAQEPERPRKGEVWEKGGMRVRLHRKAGSPTNTRGDWLWVATIVELMPELDGPWAVGETITVELDRGGWFRDSPAQEPEPVAGVERCRCPYPSSGHSTRHADDCPRRRDLSLPEWPSGPPPAQEPAAECGDGGADKDALRSSGVERATDERPEVVPADDDDLAVVEDTNVPVRHQFDWNNWFVACVVARLRHEQARAERAEAALSGVERVTDLESAVVQAAVAYMDVHGAVGGEGGYLCDAVRALRDAQEEGQ